MADINGVPLLVSHASWMQGTREYNVGEAPEASVLQELQRRQLDPPPGFAAQRMDPAQDIVQFDLLLVMDKFTAADVLREVGQGSAAARSSWSQSAAQCIAEGWLLLVWF